MNKRESQLIEILKERIKDVKLDDTDIKGGSVFSVGDGIVLARGLNDIMAGEILKFSHDIYGLALNLEENQVGIALLNDDASVKENDVVFRTHNIMEVGVGNGLLGRVVNALGQPIDGKGPIEYEAMEPVEQQASGVMTRKSIDRSLNTGTKIIDAMIPIGKGQRELIIGDRQTGKTSLAINAILAQKGKHVKCVYVAIGQKASTIAKIEDKLKKHGAMDYTVIVTAFASEGAPLQYIAPFTGCTIAEYWMKQGEDVLIIYDDLSKHAVAYRTISLLLRRPSGREAYPGDVFYLHSRLLERSGQLNDELKGGSMTALPIIETHSGDISAYIPTNVISITDGQLFLNLDSFNAGKRPAIDSGLSVSRVGSAAQSKAMKALSSSLKLELANYEELKSFAQLGTDIDEKTQAIINHGEKLTILLNQENEPLEYEYEILSLFLNKYGLLKDMDIKDIKPFESYLHRQFKENYSELLTKIKNNEWNETIIEELDKATRKIYNSYGIETYGKEFN